MNTHMWEMWDAINLLRQWQPVAHAYDLHLALGGGVLNNGYSDKDLDIVVMGMNNGKRPRFDDFCGELKLVPIWVSTDYPESGENGRRLYKAYLEGYRRVDLFVYAGGK